MYKERRLGILFEIYGNTGTAMSKWIVFLCLLHLKCVYAQDEILKNPGFEEPIDGDDWYGVSCNVTRDTDAYSGNYSARVYNRGHYWGGVSQNVPLQPNTHYYFTAYVKLGYMLNGSMWHVVDLLIELTFVDDPGNPEFRWISRMPYMRLDQGWQKIGGDFYISERAISRFRIYVQANTDEDGGQVDYFMDEASLTAFYDDPFWKESANARINEIRKNDVTIHMNNMGNYNPENLEIQVNQISQSFPFGSSVVSGQIAGDSEYNQKYQDTFYTHFNWAVLEGTLKWHVMEQEQGKINFPDKSIQRLNERGVSVRGHCIYWGKDEYVPEWLKPLSSEEVTQEMIRRMDYLVLKYSGWLAHWDVNNEQEHGSWFEEKLSQPTLMNDMFISARNRDPNVTLFLNDFEIVNGAGFTQSYTLKAAEVNTSTGLVGAVGVQSHLTGYPEVTTLQKRLEVVSTSGFPIWITELDIGGLEDKEQRADAYDDVVTLYYSQPNIDGILLWGFSDEHHHCPTCALFDGENFTANAAGERWQEMMFNRWRSYQTFYPDSNIETFGFRGFHGSYELDVYHSGELIYRNRFHLVKGQDKTVDLEIV